MQNAEFRVYIKNILLVFLTVCGIDYTFQFTVHNPLNLIFFAGLYYLYSKHCTSVEGNKEKVIYTVFSLFFSCCTVFSQYAEIDKMEMLPIFVEDMRSKGVILLWVYFIAVIGLFVLFYKILPILYHITRTWDLGHSSTTKRISGKKIYFFSMLLCLGVWLLVFTGFYPGILSIDSIVQETQAAGLAAYSNHQPWVHTMFIKLCLEIGMNVFGSANAGAAVYTISQMILVANVYAYTVLTLYRFGVKKWYLLSVIGFYIFMPYNILYSMTMWKDIPFAMAVLLFTLKLWKILNDRHKKYDWLLIFFWGALMCLLRSNGIIAYTIWAVVMLFVMKWGREKRYLIITIFCTLGVSTIVKGPIMRHFEVAPPDIIESLSIPAQQIARTVSEGYELSEEQYELLDRVVDVEKIPEKYGGTVSDGIKNLVRATGDQKYLEEHKAEYLRLWIDLGIKNPDSYLKAWIDQTYGYWYPDAQHWTVAYRIQENAVGIYQKPLIPVVFTLFQYLSNIHLLLPGYSFFWSIGFFVWIMAAMVMKCLLERKYKKIICMLPLLAIWGTLLIATPVFAEFRYMYALFTTMPVLGVIIFAKKGFD